MALPPSFSDQQVLQEDYDENYEPTEEGKQHMDLGRKLISVAMDTNAGARHWFYSVSEVLEYCKVLGLDPNTEKDLLYIAKEGIKAPLPENWKPM